MHLSEYAKASTHERVITTDYTDDICGVERTDSNPTYIFNFENQFMTATQYVPSQHLFKNVTRDHQLRH